MILVIDNYDSFVYNLSRHIGQLGYRRTVVRNDEITLDEIKTMKPSHIVISPGPRTPSEAGISLDIVHTFGSCIPILGICLGHQAIGQAYGAKVTRALKPMHGRNSKIKHSQKGIFNNIQNPLLVGRYHSLIVQQGSFSKELRCIAVSPENEVMALEHIKYPVIGLQFHPESVLTEQGYELIDNFIKIGKAKNKKLERRKTRQIM